MGLFIDRQLGGRLDSKTPLFVLVIEYEYDLEIGYAYDMGLIHIVQWIHLVWVKELLYYSIRAYCSQ